MAAPERRMPRVFRAPQNKTHALNNEIVVNALAGVIGVGITYIKDDEDILPLLKVAPVRGVARCPHAGPLCTAQHVTQHVATGAHPMLVQSSCAWGAVWCMAS